jgi:serine/threonine protein kinase/Tfp pilus assembly protein PilF
MSAPHDSDQTHAAGLAASLPAGASQVGQYYLLQKVGQGGMGEVWMAEQRDPIRRIVALKVIKGGMDTPRVVARFEAERQALAMLDHPAIAKVLDAGSTPQGLPYFVMDYVKGEPITDYCDRHRLPTSERLSLFMRVCEGVQHAHQKGIIHRDLKPSNVLVTLLEGHPVPKIIDFGIAKATGPSLTPSTLVTEFGLLVGTPTYMSPEQAEMGGLDVDTRTDIYSLGVLLYELLTGALPLDRQVLQQQAFDEVRRVIREVDPPRPSTRVTQMGPASTDAAKRRMTEPARLAGLLRGDLDWITMRALEKDRTRRYGTAIELANDVLRHLRHEPVVAGPPRASYRARKFVRRHRFGVASLALVGLLLVALATSTTLQARRIARERDRADLERRAAKEVSDFLVSLFRVSNPSESKGNVVTARELLDQAATRVSRDLERQPLTQATMTHTMAQAYMHLGLYAQAEPLLAAALQARRRWLGARHEDVRASLQLTGMLRWREGKYDDADRYLQEALRIAEQLDPGGSQVAEVLHDLGILADAVGKPAEGESRLRRALAIEEKVLAPDDPQVARTVNSLGSTLWSQGRYREAEPLFVRALALKEQRLGPSHPDVATSAANLGVLYQSQQKYREAEPLMLRAASILSTVYGPDHRLVGDAFNNLGSLYEEQRRLPEAESAYRRALAISEKSLGQAHSDVGIVLHNLANLYRNQGKHAEAEPLYLRARAIWTKAFGGEHPYLATSAQDLATLYREKGQWQASETFYQEALGMQERLLGATHPDRARTMTEYALLLRKLGRIGEAQALEENATRLTGTTAGR